MTLTEVRQAALACASLKGMNWRYMNQCANCWCHRYSHSWLYGQAGDMRLRLRACHTPMGQLPVKKSCPTCGTALELQRQCDCVAYVPYWMRELGLR